jgi:hypothetical protein
MVKKSGSQAEPRSFEAKHPGAGRSVSGGYVEFEPLGGVGQNYAAQAGRIFETGAQYKK